MRRAALFTFLAHPVVAATSGQAEQAIRPAVVIRNVCEGNRTPHGAATQQNVVASVLRTAAQQQRDALALLIALQPSPEPIVADLTSADRCWRTSPQ